MRECTRCGKGEPLTTITVEVLLCNACFWEWVDHIINQKFQPAQWKEKVKEFSSDGRTSTS